MITTEKLMAAKPCSRWPEERIRSVVGGGVSARDLSERCFDVGARIWALLATLPVEAYADIGRWGFDVMRASYAVADNLHRREYFVRSALSGISALEIEAAQRECFWTYALSFLYDIGDLIDAVFGRDGDAEVLERLVEAHETYGTT